MYRRFAILGLLAGSFFLGGDHITVAASPPAAGVARLDVTPPVGYRMSGYFHERLATGTHDPLFVRAVVLRQGDVRAAWVFCDVIGVPLEVATRARQLAAQRTGIPPANILVAATHSHTGPLYFGAMRNHFHRQAIAGGSADAAESVDYADLLVERIADAVEQADKAARPVRIEKLSLQQDKLSFNRRFHMKDGTVRFNPGKRNPNIVRVAGPIDPEVGFLLFRDAADRTPIASLTVFALHLDTVGGTEYAADYPYYLGLGLKRRLGDELVSVFGLGTCGDLNHIDVSNGERQKGGEETKRIGTALADGIVAELPRLTELAEPALAVRSRTVEVPVQQFDAEATAAARENLDRLGELPFMDRVRAYKTVALAERGGKTIGLETQVFRLSDEVAVVGLPGEVFVDLGLAIKRASPFRQTWVVELAGDAPGYIPTEKAFAEGSYETVNSRIAPGGGERLVEAAVETLVQLKSE